ncbi:MAG: hypothetical protein IJL87_07810 [Clostridia bacterium]|nr:hypothetical protein [Clostridia bacterium]
MKSVKRLIAISIAAVMMFAMTACQGDSWIVRYNGREIPTGVYTYYVYNAYQMLSYYGQVDTTKPLNKQTIDRTEGEETVAVPADKYINEYALDQVLYLCELWDRYDAAGLTLDDAVKATIETNVTGEYDTAKDTFFVPNGIAESSVKIASSNGLFGAMQDQYFESLYGENGSQAVTDDELKKYFADEYVGYSYVYRYLIDSEGQALDDAGKTAVKAELEGVKALVESGRKDFEEVCKEYQDAYTADRQSGKYGMTKTAVKKNSESELMKALLNTEVGKLTYVEIDNYAFLVKRYDPLTVGYFEENKDSLLNEYKYDPLQDEMMETAKAAKYELNKTAFKKFGIRKLKIDGVKL